MITFGNSLNRRYSIHFPFLTSYGSVNIYFHKNSSLIRMDLPGKFYEFLKQHNCWYHIYPEINESPFCHTFLDIDDKISKRFDIKNQFYNVKKEHQGRIQYTNNEAIKVAKHVTDNGEFESFLYLYGFTIDSYKGDFIYLIAERQHIDISLEKKIVRTCAIQITTESCLKEMIQMCNYINNKNGNHMPVKAEKINIHELEVK